MNARWLFSRIISRLVINCTLISLFVNWSNILFFQRKQLKLWIKEKSGFLKQNKIIIYRNYDLNLNQKNRQFVQQQLKSSSKLKSQSEYLVKQGKVVRFTPVRAGDCPANQSSLNRNSDPGHWPELLCHVMKAQRTTRRKVLTLPEWVSGKSSKNNAK